MGHSRSCFAALTANQSCNFIGQRLSRIQVQVPDGKFLYGGRVLKDLVKSWKPHLCAYVSLAGVRSPGFDLCR